MEGDPADPGQGRPRADPAPAGSVRDQLARAWRSHGELRQEEIASRSLEAAAARGTLTESEGLLMGLHRSLAHLVMRLLDCR